jgi:hypothetical protein
MQTILDDFFRKSVIDVTPRLIITCCLKVLHKLFLGVSLCGIFGIDIFGGIVI